MKVSVQIYCVLIFPIISIASVTSSPQFANALSSTRDVEDPSNEYTYQEKSSDFSPSALDDGKFTAKDAIKYNADDTGDLVAAQSYLDSEKDYQHNEQDYRALAHSFYDPNKLLSQKVVVSKTVPVPVYKHQAVRIPFSVPVPLPKPVVIPIMQPYPVQILVPHAMPIPVVKTITVPIEKQIPVPVIKEVPFRYEKLVPFTVEIPKRYPVYIPVYKHIYVNSKSKGNSGKGNQMNSGTATKGKW